MRWKTLAEGCRLYLLLCKGPLAGCQGKIFMGTCCKYTIAHLLTIEELEIKAGGTITASFTKGFCRWNGIRFMGRMDGREGTFFVRMEFSFVWLQNAYR